MGSSVACAPPDRGMERKQVQPDRTRDVVVQLAALAALAVLDEQHLIENANSVGEFLRKGALSLGPDKVVAVQGRGLLLGLRLRKSAVAVQTELLHHHIIVGTSTDPQVLRLMPPLSFSQAEAEQLLQALSEVL